MRCIGRCRTFMKAVCIFRISCRNKTLGIAVEATRYAGMCGLQKLVGR